MDPTWQRYNTMRTRFGLDGDVYLDPAQLALAVENNDVTIFEKAKLYMARLLSKDSEGVRRPAGSAFYINHEQPYLITAAHVVHSVNAIGRDLVAVYSDGTESIVSVVAPRLPVQTHPDYSNTVDAAVVKVDRGSSSPSLRMGTASVGQTVYVLGFSHDKSELNFAKGLVSSVTSTSATTDAYADNGFSGGPVFNLQMELVGMVRSGADMLEGRTNQQVRFTTAAAVAGFSCAVFSMMA